MTQISPEARAAQDTARRRDGKYGPQVRRDNDSVDLTRQRSQEIASTIRSQCQSGVLMSLGARNYVATPNGLRFHATILPMRKDGTRGTRPRTMEVEIALNGRDYYDIAVVCGEKVHAELKDVDVATLNRALLSLDYDGDEVTNPRYY